RRTPHTPTLFPYTTLFRSSLKVQWDGLDAAGAPPPVNRVVLRVASRAPTGELAGFIQVPLDLRLSRPDTLPWPPAPADAQLLPRSEEHTSELQSPYDLVCR